jgi:hypothetical protein
MTLEKSVAPMTDSSDDVSTKRFSAAAEKMQSAGFADAEQKQTPVDMAVESWIKLREKRPEHFGDTHLGATEGIESVTVDLALPSRGRRERSMI